MKKKRLIIRDKSGNVISEKDVMEDGYDSPEMYQRMDSTSEMQVTAIQPATVVSNNVPGMYVNWITCDMFFGQQSWSAIDYRLKRQLIPKLA